jgi:hypothetical protein
MRHFQRRGDECALSLIFFPVAGSATDVGRIFHSQVAGKSRHRTDAFVLLAFPGARGELLGV